MRPPSIVNRPPMPPHVCFKCKCGEHARQFFVDIGADTEFEGTIYICDSCMEDLGRATNMFYSKQVFEDKISTYLVELEELRNTWNEFYDIKEIWENNFPISLTDFTETLKKVQNGPGNVDSSIRESDSDKTESGITDNVVSLVPDSSDSSGGDEESSGQTITAPVIPLFS